jgi:hypothetical protein
MSLHQRKGFEQSSLQNYLAVCIDVDGKVNQGGRIDVLISMLQESSVFSKPWK